MTVVSWTRSCTHSAAAAAAVAERAPDGRSGGDGGGRGVPCLSRWPSAAHRPYAAAPLDALQVFHISVI